MVCIDQQHIRAMFIPSSFALQCENATDYYFSRIIGSVGITVPAATWLWQQGPKKSDHHDDHGHEDHEEHGENEEESGHNENQEPQDSEAAKESSDEEEGGDDGGDEVSKQGLDDSRHETSQQIKTVDPDADEGKKDGPDEDTDKGHEGEQKGTRVTEGDEKRKVSESSSGMGAYVSDFYLLFSYQLVALLKPIHTGAGHSGSEVSPEAFYASFSPIHLISLLLSMTPATSICCHLCSVPCH